MAEQKTRIFQMRTDQEFTRQLDVVREREDDVPSRAEMLRRLVSEAYTKKAPAKNTRSK